MGFKRDPLTPRKRLRREGRRARWEKRGTNLLLSWFLVKQLELYGTTRCENPAPTGHGGDLTLDHPELRRGVDWGLNRTLDPEKTQVLCALCNTGKGSVRGLDYRPEAMLEACRELKASVLKILGPALGQIKKPIEEQVKALRAAVKGA